MKRPESEGGDTGMLESIESRNGALAGLAQVGYSEQSKRNAPTVSGPRMMAFERKPIRLAQRAKLHAQRTHRPPWDVVPPPNNERYQEVNN